MGRRCGAELPTDLRGLYFFLLYILAIDSSDEETDMYGKIGFKGWGGLLGFFGGVYFYLEEYRLARMIPPGLGVVQ